MKLPKPTKKQTKKIVKIICKDKKIKIVRSRKWYRFLKKRIAVKYLERMGCTAIDAFLATRFMLVRVIKKFLLFAPRVVGNKGIDDLKLFAHELKHISQEKKEGMADYKIRYLENPGDRAVYEGQAYGVGADIDYVYGRFSKINADKIFDADFRKMYKLNREQAESAKIVFERSIQRRKSGRISEEASYVLSVMRSVVR